MLSKIMISEEAKFDYEVVFEGEKLPVGAIKKELEEYFSSAKHSERYVVLKYNDEEKGMLLLFLRKGSLFRSMQIWVLAGVCHENDYDEELDEKGLIKNWLDSFIV